MELSKGERTKVLILKQTSKLILKEGFTELSFQKIADKCGLSQAAVIKHFPSKQILYSEVREMASKSNRDWLEQKLQGIDSAVELIAEYAYQSLAWTFAKPSDAQMLLLGYYYSTTSKSLHKVQMQAWQRSDERIMNYLKLAKEQKLINKNAELEFLCVCIHQYVTGLCIREFVSNNQAILKPKLRENLQKYFQSILSGAY